MTKLEAFKKYVLTKGYEIMKTNEGALMFCAPYEDTDKIYKYIKNRLKMPLNSFKVRYSHDYKEVIIYAGGKN
jgi:hypothetical protein